MFWQLAVVSSVIKIHLRKTRKGRSNKRVSGASHSNRRRHMFRRYVSANFQKMDNQQGGLYHMGQSPNGRGRKKSFVPIWIWRRRIRSGGLSLLSLPVEIPARAINREN